MESTELRATEIIFLCLSFGASSTRSSSLSASRGKFMGLQRSSASFYSHICCSLGPIPSSCLQTQFPAWEGRNLRDHTPQRSGFHPSCMAGRANTEVWNCNGRFFFFFFEEVEMICEREIWLTQRWWMGCGVWRLPWTGAFGISQFDSLRCCWRYCPSSLPTSLAWALTKALNYPLTYNIKTERV